MKRAGIKPGTSTLKRSTPLTSKKPMNRGVVALKSKQPMERGTSQLARASAPMKAVGARARRTGQGKVAPTAAEQSWMNSIAAFGCIVCHQQTGTATAAEIHHIKQGDRRMGHLFTLPLCYWHHRGGDKDGPYISRHPWKARFESAYGAELDLLALLQKNINTSK